jgi:Phage terminase, small subunit
MGRVLGSHLESTKPKAKLVPGKPVKSESLSEYASKEWDRILASLEASGIELSPAHHCTLVVCATLRADIRDCWKVLQANGGNYTTAGTGAVKLHPAAARLDVLRRDLTKALALLGLQKPVPDADEDDSQTLEDVIGA